LGAIPKIWGGGFGCAIGAVGGSARGFPPRGCGGSFEVDAGRLGLAGSVFPLGFLDGGAGGLVVGDNVEDRVHDNTHSKNPKSKFFQNRP